jgi:SAM-dependent methyltransferase
LITSPLLLITNFEKFRHKAFAKLWGVYGQAMSEEMPPGTVDLVATANGVVLDIGPGTGTQLHLFTPSKVKKIYGAEPAIDMHLELKRSADQCLLGEKYEILAAGAEPSTLIPALAKRNLLGTSGQAGQGIFDTIVSVRALCGVPDQEETAAGLYRLLRPGGRLLLCEHVKQLYPHGGDLIASVMQRVYMLVGWSFWLGGCCLNRDTEAVLRKIAGPGGWKEVKLTHLQPYAAIPYIVGEFIKA